MLVLSRKSGETIKIGDDIFITIVRIGSNTVRVGITAPRDAKVLRGEFVLEVPAGTSDDAILEQVQQQIEIKHLESE